MDTWEDSIDLPFVTEPPMEMPKYVSTIWSDWKPLKPKVEEVKKEAPDRSDDPLFGSW